MLERAEILMLLGRNEEAITVFESCFNDYGYGMYMCGNYEKCGDAYRAIGHMTEACMYWNIAIKNDDPEFDPASPSVKIKVMENCK